MVNVKYTNLGYPLKIFNVFRASLLFTCIDDLTAPTIFVRGRGKISLREGWV